MPQISFVSNNDLSGSVVGPNYILPPPPGQSNSLYEASPQGPGTTDYTIPGTTINRNNAGINGPVFSGATISGPGVSRGSAAGSTTTQPAGSAGVQDTTSANPPRITVTPSGTQGIAPGSLADYFARAIIIVLGFIFVAVGLNMLRPGTVPSPGGFVRRNVTRPI